MTRGLSWLWAIILALGGATPVDELVKEQKYQEALTAVEKDLATAKAKGDADAWTRGLIQATQLKRGLGQAETAVQDLKAAAWPQGLKAKALLTLFYGEAISGYLQTYGYEIDQREAVDTKGKVDLKAMTRGQLWDEALKAYQEVWEQREALANVRVSDWKEFIEPNDYPAGVRGTMRDALSYFAVELLGNTGNWRPEDSNDAFKLDFLKLLRAPAAAYGGRLDDRKEHPLARVAGVLGDLESWHAGRGEKDGALEARLARMRQLLGTFTAADKRGAAAAYLDEILPGYKDASWWSTGSTERAELAQTAGDLVLAHKLAKAAAAAYPKSPGGQRGAQLAAVIAAPDYQLMGMATDGIGKRSLLITHKNLPKVYFRAYRMDLVGEVEATTEYTVLPGEAAWKRLKDKKPELAWEQALPATPDFAEKKTYVTPPLKAKGLYLIVASVTPSFTPARNRVLSVPLVVSDLVVTVRGDRDRLAASVLDGAHGAPVAGATVRVYPYEYGKKR
jgi:hypothetical protein